MKKRLYRILVAALMVLVNVISVPVSAANKMSEKEIFFYGQNNIIYYNPYGSLVPDGCEEMAPEGTTAVAVDISDVYVTGDDNAGTIMGMLMNNGYTKESAAAILGNLYAESRLNPMIIQGGEIVTVDFRAWDGGGKTYNGGFGLVQWDFYTRVEALQNYADSHGLPVASVQAQVGFMIEELASYGYGPDSLNSMSLEDATYQIWRNYENPATNDYETRLGFAREFLNTEPAGLPERVEASGYGNFVNCVISEYGGHYEGPGNAVSVDGVVAFLQCDPAWGDLNFGEAGVNGSGGSTICAAGCGPTSFASIAATLGIATDPVEAADVAGKAGMYVRGSGSSWRITEVLAEHYGLHFEKLESYSVEYINSLLRQGKMIHVAGSGSMPYTSGGHYIAIVGISDSGEWIVTDSGHSEDTAIATYDPNQIVAGMHVGSAGVVWR